jgi:antitoxin component YwqK of YwqJK toxin-antitoxin module
MKRRLTFVSLAIVLGMVGWGPSDRAHAEKPAAAVSEPSQDSAEALLADDQPTAAQPDGASPDGAGPTEATSPSVETSEGDNAIEVIRERYPNRSVKIEREVTQDAEGNYVNHGSWKMWDPQGSLVAEGQYHYGERAGVWNRWFRTGEVELLKAVPYNAFKGPFISQASFEAGRLSGKWTIFDSSQHKISEFEFVDGERHGDFTWWFPNGQKMRECHYESGEMNGQLVEWAQDSRVVTQVTFDHGRRLGSRAEKHTAGGNKSEGRILFAKEILQTGDDWWNAKPAVYTKQGKDERHGHWTVWFPNGQKQVEGDYDHDVQIGEFTWWYANGQRSLQGEYTDGEQQGKWVWWYENGQKSIVGEYSQGHPMGRWTWWNEEGKVARASDMAQGAGEIVQQAPAPLPSLNPTPPQPAPQSANRTSRAPAPSRPARVR